MSLFTLSVNDAGCCLWWGWGGGGGGRRLLPLSGLQLIDKGLLRWTNLLIREWIVGERDMSFSRILHMTCVDGD